MSAVFRCDCGHAYNRHKDQPRVADGGRCRIYGCGCVRFVRADARALAIPEGRREIALPRTPGRRQA